MATDRESISREDIRVVTEDGQPALEIGDMTILLRTFVKVSDKDEPMGDRHLETLVETESDDGAVWWNITKDDTELDEHDPYPWVTIQPEVER